MSFVFPWPSDCFHNYGLEVIYLSLGMTLNLGRKQVLAHQPGDTCSSSPSGGVSWVLPIYDRMWISSVLRVLCRQTQQLWVHECRGQVKSRRQYFTAFLLTICLLHFSAPTSPLWWSVNFAGGDIVDPMAIFLHQSLVLCLRIQDGEERQLRMEEEMFIEK